MINANVSWNNSPVAFAYITTNSSAIYLDFRNNSIATTMNNNAGDCIAYSSCGTGTANDGSATSITGIYENDVSSKTIYLFVMVNTAGTTVAYKFKAVRIA